VANELLSRRRSLEPGGSENSLANQIVQADALILTIDASADAGQVEADFAGFSQFLHLLRIHRGERTEVAGLPVFLVLTKGDLLARPDDTSASWTERLEETKRQRGEQLKNFFAKADAPLAFGAIDVTVRATAVKRPALAGNPAEPREPFGVAE